MIIQDLRDMKLFIFMYTLHLVLYIFIHNLESFYSLFSSTVYHNIQSRVLLSNVRSILVSYGRCLREWEKCKLERIVVQTNLFIVELKLWESSKEIYACIKQFEFIGLSGAWYSKVLWLV